MMAFTRRQRRLALVAFGLIALSVLTATVDAFDSDKLYKYQFEGAITTKVADDDKPQYSGMALSSPIAVRKSGTNEITLRLEKPQTATFNDVIDDIHTYPLDYKPIEPTTSGGLDKAFRIYFDPESGSVKSFDSHKDEPKWVTNFKRGLLSFFQLKLKDDSSSSSSTSASSSSSSATTSSSSTTTSSGSSSPSSSSSAQRSHHHQYYTIPERSIFGECETDYLVMSEPLQAGSSPQTVDDSASGQQQLVMNVTKTRNMARCKSRFLYRFMPIDSNECYENEKELQQYKHSNAIFQYDLVGTAQNFVIEQVLLDEMSIFSPFGQRAHSHSINSKFMMKLMSTETPTAATAPQVDEQSLVRLESLSYDPPEMVNFYANVNLDQEHHLSSIYQGSASVEQVMQAFEALVQEHRAYTGAFEQATNDASRAQEKSRLAELFIRLNELVGTLNSQKIEQLYILVDERGEAHKKIFWDLMSVTGTNPSFVFMKRLITDGDAPSVKIKDFLTRLSYHIKMPSKSLFDEYVNLCKSDKIQTNQQYKRLCSLPLASLIHQHCAKPHAKYLRLQQEGSNATAYKRGQNTCQIATADEYFSRLVTPWASSSSGSSAGSSSSSSSDSGDLSIGDKMLQVKMAGELGVKPSIDFLMDVVSNRDEHPSLRSAAMWNLYKSTRIYPNQIKRLVVPYYQDQGELLELRLAAFHNWLSAGMSLHEMETMAKQLQREPSRQVVIYIHSLMQSLANANPFPCGHSEGRHARLVLGTIKKALARHSAASLSDSHASFTSTWNEEFNYGTASLMSVIFSNESMAPSNVFYSSSEIMSGLKLTPMSVSIQAHGLDKLIKRVAGINGLLAEKESFMDVFSLKRRSKRQVSADLIKQEAQEIDKELKLATREFSDVFLSVTISAYGRPVSFFDKDSRELKKMLSEDGTIRIPQIKKLLHSFNNHTTQQMMVTFEKLEVFNNELGLPLYQSISDFDYKTFKLNSIKLDVEPGFFRDERQGKPPTKLATALDAKMGRHNEMFVSTGAIVSSEKLLVGVGFHKKKLVNIPIKMSVEANLTASQVQVRRQPIHESLLYIKQTPVTFVRSYDLARPVRPVGNNSDQPAEKWLPLYSFNKTSQMKPFKLDYMTPLAVGVTLEGKHLAGQDWSMAAWRRYLNQAGMAAAKFMYMYSPTGQPLEARLSTITTEENPTKELVTQLSWRHYHNHDHSDAYNDLSDIEKELEKFTANRKGAALQGRPTTVSYKLALIGGSSKERRVGLDIAYSYSFDRLLHKWRAFYSRTPLDQAAPSSEVTNLCWLGQMDFPEQQADKLLNFQLADLNFSANLTSELTFGDECPASGKLGATGGATGPHVSARLMANWSQQQRAEIEAALASGTSTNSSGGGGQREMMDAEHLERDYTTNRRNPYARLYRQCLARREQHGSKLDPSCVSLMRRLGALTHISAQFEYKDVPQRWTKLVRRLGSLYTYARAGYIDEMEERSSEAREYKSADGQNDVAHLEANITMDGRTLERKLSYEFDTPNYHVKYGNVPISVPPLSTFSLLGSSFYQQVQNRAGRLSCLVSGQSVSTFDNLTYLMPAVGDGCFKLIAKDCSPEANFVVLGAKVGPSKVVKVYLAQKFKVEFVPDKDGKRISDIKVNGETVQIEMDKPALRRDTKLGTQSVEAFTIDYNGAYYTLNSKLYKFSVSTDGTWILVQQSKYYAGKSCGICGDANGDHLLEFKSPVSARRICKNTADFVWSYVLPSTCASRPANIECA
uniref:Vitellogenin-6 n=1 Tax=Aceria tosichella TaxID=561515 RepID=A0A6G1S5R7_9ACAR